MGYGRGEQRSNSALGATSPLATVAATPFPPTPQLCRLLQGGHPPVSCTRLAYLQDTHCGPRHHPGRPRSAGIPAGACRAQPSHHRLSRLPRPNHTPPPIPTPPQRPRLMKHSLVTRQSSPLAQLPTDTADGYGRHARLLLHSAKRGAWIVFFETGAPPGAAGANGAGQQQQQQQQQQQGGFPEQYSWSVLNGTCFEDEGVNCMVSWVRPGGRSGGLGRGAAIMKSGTESSGQVGLGSCRRGGELLAWDFGREVVQRGLSCRRRPPR